MCVSVFSFFFGRLCMIIFYLPICWQLFSFPISHSYFVSSPSSSWSRCFLLYSRLRLLPFSFHVCVLCFYVFFLLLFLFFPLFCCLSSQRSWPLTKESRKLHKYRSQGGKNMYSCSSPVALCLQQQQQPASSSMYSRPALRSNKKSLTQSSKNESLLTMTGQKSKKFKKR